jgi:hypothetical protein
MICAPAGAVDLLAILSSSYPCRSTSNSRLENDILSNQKIPEISININFSRGFFA